MTTKEKGTRYSTQYSLITAQSRHFVEQVSALLETIQASHPDVQNREENRRGREDNGGIEKRTVKSMAAVEAENGLARWRGGRAEERR
jgi:hypothetical protein